MRSFLLVELALPLPSIDLRESAQVVSPPSLQGRSSATQSPITGCRSGEGLKDAVLALPACASALDWAVMLARAFSERRASFFAFVSFDRRR